MDSGDDLEDESDFEGYDDDMFERAMGGGGGGGRAGAAGQAAGGDGSSSGGKGRWFTKNGRGSQGWREGVHGGAAMARYRRDGGSTGATGGDAEAEDDAEEEGDRAQEDDEEEDDEEGQGVSVGVSLFGATGR